MSTLAHADFTGRLSALVVKDRAAQTGKSLRTIQRRVGGLKTRHLRRVGSDKAGRWEVLEP
jgi:hypothetical protein